MGPQVGHIEDVEVLGMGATVAEVGLAALLSTQLNGAHRGWTMNAVVVLGGTLWAFRIVGILP